VARRLGIIAIVLGAACTDRDPARETANVANDASSNGDAGREASDGEAAEASPDVASEADGADSTAAGDASEAGDGESEAEADALAPQPPNLLSATGLYENLSLGERLAAGVMEYRPRFELWSDGAEKRRFVSLPAGSRIDTSDMDYWVYPVGTRLWKEFRRDGVRVETRLLEKTGPGSWSMIAYAWNAQGSDAAAVPAGASDVLGTGHDIPSRVMCGECHNHLPDRVLGFSAVQLSHGLGGVALGDLAAAARLTVVPPASLEVPGGPNAHAALGYLHANCGNCHNPRSGVFPTVAMELWLSVASLQTVEATPSYRTTVGVPLQGVRPTPDTPGLRIAPRDPAGSAVHHRMSARDPLAQMPPLATELPDAVALSLVAAWISEL
jgi:hypothetical protein